ncbi:DUF2207 domain-containing protein [Compostimonas suwonensis]|uniref:Putative membrane protein DUF2207 n=1 Tax=Compostimonas suwonensis TaxID=1048394 RepID=A0A2M9BTY7_9MICO|nr:DUF2207 domain-containing protein [Compostimonas suwonensis]PJJ61417.1 putative membrane protein DUF2207 [Compostimonas suwonensis]
MRFRSRHTLTGLFLLGVLGTVTALTSGAASAAIVQPQATQQDTLAVRGDVDDFRFGSFSVDYYLSSDEAGTSTLHTVETFVAEFPDFDQNRGIVRAIPDDYDGVPLRTTVQSVTDALGNPVPYETTHDDGFTELALGTDEFVHGEQTYVISYDQVNVVRHFNDTNSDEFYWDTNGTGFAQPFGSVTVRVHVTGLPVEGLNGDFACYQGAQNSTENCTIEQGVDPAVDVQAGAPAPALFSASAGPLEPGENLTVAIGFASGTFVVPEAPGQSWAFTILPWIVGGLSALAAAVMLLLRRVLWPNAKGRGTIIPQYSVPEGVNLLVAADIAGRTSSGLQAQLISFAVRGNIHILDYPVTEKGAAASGTFTLQFVHADGVDEQEQGLLSALFRDDLTPGAVRELGVASQTLAAKLAALPAATRRLVVGRGLRTKPTAKFAPAIVLLSALLVVASIVLFVIAMAANADVPWIFWVIVLAVVGFALCLRWSRPPEVLTPSGAELSEYLEGMRVYLDLAEKDRFRYLQSPEGAERIDVSDGSQIVKLYERLLPFAVLWGVEDRWAGELAVRYEQLAAEPNWFVSANGFQSANLAVALSSFSLSAASSATVVSSSSWSGSSGGSFGGGSMGGGFSGGGGGGGGGGGR